MPVLNPAIIADCRAKIDEKFGPINPSLDAGQQAVCDASRDKLAAAIAEAGIYSRDNNLVNVGQSVAVPATGILDSLGHPCTGLATGTVDTTGTWS